ncbi:MAG: NAD(P)H-dependent oxidoreductase subunit E [Nitriliruptoraceae bacterium]
MPISDATREEARHLIARYPVARSALLPLLHLVSGEEGYVSEDGIAMCAELLQLTKAEVGAVATFYTMYKREPFGDYLLSVCTNPTCGMQGGREIYEAYVDELGGHIDRDGAGVMVEHAECLGICDAAPVVQINYEMYGPVTREQALELLAKARAGDPPASNRSGEVPPPIRQVHREFSGIEDTFGDHLVEAARLQAAAEVPPAYRSAETDLPVTHPGGDPAGHGGAAFREVAALELVALAEPGANGAAGGGSDRLPEVAPADETEAEVVGQVAEKQPGASGDLARQATGADTEPVPAAGAQPGLETRQGEAPSEAEPTTDRGDDPTAADEQADGATDDEEA